MNTQSDSSQKVSLWSASPTPFLADRRLDVCGIQRMVEWHLRQGVDGLMIAGTCGEGPWLPERQKLQLMTEAVQSAKGRLSVAMQVTDNSPARILEQIEVAEKAGVDLAVVAQPYFGLRSRLPDFVKFYGEICDRSPLPLGFYDRGASASVPVPTDAIEEIVSHPKVAFVKDSSVDHARAEIYKKVRNDRNGLTIMSGNEFRVLENLRGGFDGFMLGGTIVNASYVQEIISAHQAGDAASAEAVNEALREMLWTVYGGKTISCWLAGLKYMLVRMGIFSTEVNYPDYATTAEDRKQIGDCFKAFKFRFQ